MSHPPEPSPEEAEIIELIGEFLGIGSWDDAQQFADAHPELRDVGVVTTLVNTAQLAAETDEQQATHLYQYAMLLCGSDDPEVAATVAQVAGMAISLTDGPPKDRGLAGTFLALVDSGDAIAKIGTTHVRIEAQLFDAIAVVVANLARYTNDPSGLLDIAVGHAQAAVCAIPADSNERPGYLSNLANHCADLFTATGNREHLHTAVEHAQEAVDATPPDSNDRPGRLNNLANHVAALYAETGNREHLHTAVEYAQDAVHATPTDSTERPGFLSNLTSRFAELYQATGNREHLHTAVEHAQEAFEPTPADSNNRPGYLSNLAILYADLHAWTGNREHLHLAVGHAQEVVDATPADSNDRPGRLNNLAVRYADLYEATGNHGYLHTAVGHAREAVDATPVDSTERPGFLCNLASHYADLYQATGEEEWLEDGLSVLVRSESPLKAVRIERTRARLLVDLDRCGEAARVLEAASRLLEEERLRLGGDSEGLRDLAGAVEGLTSDLAFLHVQLGEGRQAVEVLERPRIWLSQPPATRAAAVVECPTVWVVPSDWGTALISRVDHEFTVAEASLTREDLTGLVVDMLNAQRAQSASDETLTLVKAAGAITALLPAVDRLLVIPIGVASLMPWYACTGPTGRQLIETTTITVAPTFAWATAKPVSSGGGSPVGFFHPGLPGADNWLDLRADRRTFTNFAGGEVRDSPNLTATLEALQSDASVGHFSCHAGYNILDPLGSTIQLGDPVTLRDLLAVDRCPPLINLSACETGIPDLSRAEQALSFPTGFLRAGASQVIGTLWPIRNDIATAFNTAFYTNLNNRSDPADACRAAIQNLIDQVALPITSLKKTTSDDAGEAVPDETWADPANWAAFAHYGNPTPKQRP